MQDHPTKPLGTIRIVKESIINLKADVIVNAANAQLAQGGGVCGVIFRAAGAMELGRACRKIGHCDTGSAVITPAFAHKNSRYIIHAVGPVWRGGGGGEAELLYRAYYAALELARKNGCRSIAFPLISSGIYGYPIHGAWQQAMHACMDFLRNDPTDEIEIIFAVLQEGIAEEGRTVLEQIVREK